MTSKKTTTSTTKKTTTPTTLIQTGGMSTPKGQGGANQSTFIPVFRLGVGVAGINGFTFFAGSAGEVIQKLQSQPGMDAWALNLANQIPGLPPIKNGDIATAWAHIKYGLERAGNTNVNGKSLTLSDWISQAANENLPTSSSDSKGPTASQQTAYATVVNNLDMWGLDSLAPQVWNMTMQAGDKNSTAEVMLWIRNTPEYQNRFQGKPTDMTESEYTQHESEIKTALAYAGIPASLGTAAEIGTLIGNGIYGQNLSDRLTKGYEAAMAAPPETRKLLQDYYGMSTGDLAGYYLNPTTTMNDIVKRNQAASIGDTAYQTGFQGTGTGGELSKTIAEALSDQMTGTGYSMDYFRTGFGKASALQPLEQTQIGQRGQAIASSNQILSSEFTGLNATLGTNAAQDAESVNLAEEARKAGLSGGGGFAQTARGGVGVGRTSTEGTGK